MNIDNLVQLIRGELYSKPSVSWVENFCYDPNAITRGDIFMAVDRAQSSVDLAIKNGAYAILYDRELKISDKEIAWIKVDSIEMSIMRLMRFQSSYKKFVFVTLSFLQEEILRTFKQLKNAYILPTNFIEAFLTIMNAPEESYIFCSSSLMLQKVAPIHESIWTETKVQNLSGGSLFISSFVHQGQLYQNIPMSPIFIPAMCGVLSFLNLHNLEYVIENMKSMEHFEPLFIDKFFSPQPFGQTRRALIVESNEELFLYEAKMLKKIVPNKNFITCKPKKSSINFQTTYSYSDESYLKMLNDYKFTYALVLGDKSAIENALLKEEKERYPTLF